MRVIKHISGRLPISPALFGAYLKKKGLDRKKPLFLKLKPRRKAPLNHKCWWVSSLGQTSNHWRTREPQYLGDEICFPHTARLIHAIEQLKNNLRKLQRYNPDKGVAFVIKRGINNKGGSNKRNMNKNKDHITWYKCNCIVHWSNKCTKDAEQGKQCYHEHSPGYIPNMTSPAIWQVRLLLDASPAV